MKQRQIKFIFFNVLVILGLMVVACTPTTTPPESAEMAMDMSPTDKDGDTDMDSMDTTAIDELPADLNTATQRMTDNDFFQASIRSNMMPVDINQIHSWTLHLETPDGETIDDAEVAIDGGMPQHNHGFPTSPQITDNLGNGDYLVEGVRFNMTGWWEIKFDISAGGKSDTITFNVVVETGHGESTMGEMDHDNDDDHAEHSDMDHNDMDHSKVPNEGRVINIITPKPGTEFAVGSMVMIKIETESFDLADAANHWHLYLNDELHTMVEDGRIEVMLHDLPAGDYTIMTTLADTSHVEYEDGAMVTITVK